MRKQPGGSRGLRVALSLSTALLILTLASAQAEEFDVRLAPAFTGSPEKVAKLAHFNDATRAGERIVVVGQSGIVLYSDDEAQTWRQGAVPVSLALTAVYFVDENNGWAVGHDQLILRTADGGKNWVVQNFEPEVDLPLLDVMFKDAQEGFAVGGRGRVYQTTDGGENWQLTEVLTNNELVPDAHLFSILASSSGALFMTAEVGALFRSRDNGASWQQLASPYHGSFFGVAFPCNQRIVAYAMLGNAAVSDDDGETWQRNDFPIQRSMLNSWQVENGPLVIMGVAGRIVTSEDCGKTFENRSIVDQVDLTAGLPLKNGQWLFATPQGLRTADLDLN